MYRVLSTRWDAGDRLVVGHDPEQPPTDFAFVPLNGEFEILERMLAHELVTTFVDTQLKKVDRASMAVSVEARAPFMDYRVVEFAFTLPPDLKVRGETGKYILRRVLHRHVPEALYQRPKMGFHLPLSTWLRGPLREWAEDLLDPSCIRQEGLLDPDPIRVKWHEHLTGRRDRADHLWPVLMFRSWLRHHGAGVPPCSRIGGRWVFTDARHIAADSTLQADICIVGAGIAGISIAREFIGRPERVVLLEGGGLEFTKSLRDLPTVLRRHTLGEQALASGRNAGQPYYPLRFTRVRAFGGSSRAWHEDRGVHVRPLDAIDFEARDGLPEHGWPIDRAQLDPFYERAQQICGLGPFAYDAETWEAQGYGAPLPLDPKLVKSVIFQFGKHSRFDRYEDDFARAENVNLVLHATAVHLADRGGRVVRMDCATLSGNRFSVQRTDVRPRCGGDRDRSPAAGLEGQPARWHRQ